MERQKITKTQQGLNVPDNPVIGFIEGDGIGPDIWNASKQVFDAAVEHAYNGKRQVDWEKIYAGGEAYAQKGEWLPKDTLDFIREYLVAIKGPLTTPVGGGIRSLNVALRQQLDLYTCLRPVRYFQGVPSPVKDPSTTNMVIFRENSEDIYAGIEWSQETDEAKKITRFLQDEMGVDQIRFPETTSIGIKPVSKEGTERLVRAAINYALHHNLPSVTVVHKGNIMKYTEGKFKEWSYELAEREFPGQTFTWAEYDRILEEKGKEAADKAEDDAKAAGKLVIKDAIADAFLQQILTRPANFSVIATLNLNGDYVSDAIAAIVGGIGIAPGANINYETGHAIFEATHGTAPRYANQDKVNPGSMMLSGAMMFDYIGWQEAAHLIREGLQKTVLDKKVTYDFARQMEGATKVKCSEFGEAIVNNMKRT